MGNDTFVTGVDVGDVNGDFGDGDGARGHCNPTKIDMGGVRKWDMVRLWRMMLMAMMLIAFRKWENKT